jgi:hypothetical protein
LRRKILKKRLFFAELRKIIETLAQYVAKNGTNFEDMVKNREVNNPQFFFLRGGDFHRYYQHCVAVERLRLDAQADVDPNSIHQQPSSAGPPQQQPQPTPLLSAVQRAAAIAASLVQAQQQQQAPSMSGAYHQQNSFNQYSDPAEQQNYARQPFSYGAPPGKLGALIVSSLQSSFVLLFISQSRCPSID